ncbi:MAG TPA: hypothetical protein VEL31_02275 [Ktedonobacteraceae bacterium]|nr:hypothetical protein [Ktedonobacteraceae bacterium]
MVGTVLRLFLRFLRDCWYCLCCEMSDRLAGRHSEWRLVDVVVFCWRDFTLAVVLSWRASQYDRRMRKFRRSKGLR